MFHRPIDFSRGAQTFERNSLKSSMKPTNALKNTVVDKKRVKDSGYHIDKPGKPLPGPKKAMNSYTRNFNTGAASALDSKNKLHTITGMSDNMNKNDNGLTGQRIGASLSSIGRAGRSDLLSNVYREGADLSGIASNAGRPANGRFAE